MREFGAVTVLANDETGCLLVAHPAIRSLLQLQFARCGALFC